MRLLRLVSLVVVVGLTIGNPIPYRRTADHGNKIRTNPETNVGESISKALRDPKLLTGSALGLYLIWLANRRRSRRVTRGSVSSDATPGTVNPDLIADTPSTPNAPPADEGVLVPSVEGIRQQQFPDQRHATFVESAPEWYKQMDRYFHMNEQQRQTEGYETIRNIRLRPMHEDWIEECKRRKDAVIESRGLEPTENARREHDHDCRLRMLVEMMRHYEWQTLGQQGYREMLARRGVMHDRPGEERESETTSLPPPPPPENLQLRLNEIKMPSWLIPSVDWAAIGSSVLKSAQSVPKNMPKAAVLPLK